MKKLFKFSSMKHFLYDIDTLLNCRKSYLIYFSRSERTFDLHFSNCVQYD